MANVLEGSVRKANNRVRITAQLVKTKDGYHLWSETFDRDLDDIFAIQADIAKQVAQALSVTLLGGGNKQPAKRTTRRPTRHTCADSTFYQGAPDDPQRSRPRGSFLNRP